MNFAQHNILAKLQAIQKRQRHFMDFECECPDKTGGDSVCRAVNTVIKGGRD
jgi:hypothetical protein